MFYGIYVFLLCDFYDFHLFFVSVILLLKIKKAKLYLIIVHKRNINAFKTLKS
jgi:hypothetical protein